jgi:AraC family transcriptional activator of pobA
MPDKDKIYSLDLMYNDSPMPFVIKTMEEIDRALGGIADKPHRHNYYTIVWPVTATGRHIIDFKEYAIQPNHIFFVSPGQVHQITTDPDPTGYVLLFTPEFLEKNSIRNDFIFNLKLFQKCDETPPLPVSDQMADRLRTFADQMISAFQNQNDMFLEVIGAYLKLFLIECNNHCSLTPGSNLQKIEVSKTLVKNFREAVEKDFAQNHQVQYYAETLNVTPNYLNNVIKTSIEISAKDYIQNKLILEAKRMVIFTEMSAKEIGFELGFDDPSHFSKFFKINTGQSLQEFKDRMAL